MDSSVDSIRSRISDGLYGAIRDPYESGNYSNAILDAMKHLTKFLREHSKQDGDGATLVGSILGGQKPIIPINNLKTTSDWDEQHGFEQILRGLYQGIRNPRTHEIFTDTKESCDSIVGFIEYVESVILRNTSVFNLDEYKKKIFDPLFVENRSYAEEIFKYLPEQYIFELFQHIFIDRQNGNADKLKIVFDYLYNKIPNLDAPKLSALISNYLRNANDSSEFISILRYLQSKIWLDIETDAKMRAESAMIDSVKIGYYDQKCLKGQLGTWATTFANHFKLRNDLKTAITGLLRSNWYSQNYIAQYFFTTLPEIFTSQSDQDECCDNLIYAGFDNKSNEMREVLRTKISWLPNEWRIKLLEKSKKYQGTDASLYQAMIEEKDDLPF